MKNLGYIRIPKTGSRCIANYLLDSQNKYLVCGQHHLPYTVLSTHPHEHNYFSFVRDPIQTYSSFYFFMKKRLLNPKEFNNPLEYTNFNEKNVTILSSNATLEDFLLNCPQNQMIPYFIKPMGIENLSFIGISEKMDQSIFCFNKIFNLNVINYVANQNLDKNFKEKYFVNHDVEKQFKKRNEEEYEMYNISIEKFKKIYERIS